MLINPTIFLRQFISNIPNTVDGGNATSVNSYTFDGGKSTDSAYSEFILDGGKSSPTSINSEE